MHTSTWKHIGIAVATLAGFSLSAAILWALYGNALVPVERVMPAGTAAFITNADPEDLQVLRTWLPALSAAPELTRQETAALVPVQAGRVELAVLTPGASLKANPYTVEGSEQARQALNGKGSPLERSPEYLALLPKKLPEAARAYVNPPLLGSGAWSTPWRWLKSTRPMAVTLSPDAADIIVADDGPLALPTLAKQVPMAFQQPIAVVQGTDLLTLWDRAANAMEPHARFAIRSLGMDAARKRLGKDVSLTYDVLPLLRGDTVLHVGREGANIRFLAEGLLIDEGEERLEAIADAFRANLPAVKRETLTFDRGFVSDTLAEDPEVVEDRLFSVEGWSVRAIRHTESNQALVLAEKGDRFMLSDSPAAVEARIRGTYASRTLGGVNGSLLASGYVHRALASEIVAVALGKDWTGSVRLPAGFGSEMLWSLTRERSRAVLHVESLNASPAL